MTHYLASDDKLQVSQKIQLLHLVNLYPYLPTRLAIRTTFAFCLSSTPQYRPFPPVLFRLISFPCIVTTCLFHLPLSFSCLSPLLFTSLPHRLFFLFLLLSLWHLWLCVGGLWISHFISPISFGWSQVHQNALWVVG